MKLSDIQRSLVNEALEFTTEANFKIDSKLTHSDKFIIWQQKMFESFNRDAAHMLFASMEMLKRVDDNTSNSNAPYEPPPTTSCGCATKSDWCSAPGGLHFYCKSGGCVVVTSDCGTFWNYDCNGDCAQIITYIPN